MEKRVKTRYAESLPEVYQHIYSIGKEIQETEGDKNPTMWFRGHARSYYNLEPNIFRKADYGKYNKKGTYSINHLREEYRFQSFMSRNYDNMDNRVPQTVIEWQEVMQHFFTKTRLMDWSESLTVALEFALESFITPVKDLEIQKRYKEEDPVIWILQPIKLNKKVYSSFTSDKGLGLIRKVLSEEDETLAKGKDSAGGKGSAEATDPAKDKALADEIWAELKKEQDRGIYYNIKDEQEKNMNALIGLSSLEIIRQAYRGREREALRMFELNPFFYLLLRYYSDGIPVNVGELPPLAIIHPYHSQRIKTQKGVFTVFPYYMPDAHMERIKSVTEAYPPLGMEYMPDCIPCLYSIHIMNPQRVAKELMQTGARRGNLYPDMQIVSQDMENVVK